MASTAGFRLHSPKPGYKAFLALTLREPSFLLHYVRGRDLQGP